MTKEQILADFIKYIGVHVDEKYGRNNKENAARKAELWNDYVLSLYICCEIDMKTYEKIENPYQN